MICEVSPEMIIEDLFDNFKWKRKVKTSYYISSDMFELEFLCRVGPCAV